MQIPTLVPGAAPQFYRGNGIGCLVIHGFMASPGEVGWLGKHLAEQDYTVYVPRLTGHGINPKHMTRMRWEDWYAQVLDAYYILKQQCEQVYAIGHSMGGMLALLLAANEPVDGVVPVATPLQFDGRVLPYTRQLSGIMPFTHQPSEPELNALIEAEQKRRNEAIHSRVHYARWATRAVYEIYRLSIEMRPYLGKVTVPLLLLYAQNDTTAPLVNMDMLTNAVKSNIIEKHILKTGSHIIFQDVGRDEAFQVVADFIARRAAAKCEEMEKRNAEEQRNEEAEK
jgi:carboxylesterase